MGGFITYLGRPVGWFADSLSQEDIRRFQLTLGSSKHQTFLEALAILVAARLWGALWKGRRLAVCVRSDSLAALGAINKQRSNASGMSMIMREFAIDIADGDIHGALPCTCPRRSEYVGRHLVAPVGARPHHRCAKRAAQRNTVYTAQPRRQLVAAGIGGIRYRRGVSRVGVLSFLLLGAAFGVAAGGRGQGVGRGGLVPWQESVSRPCEPAG